MWKYSSHTKTRDCYAEIKIVVSVYKSILSISQFCIAYLLYLIANPKVSIRFWNIDTRVIGVLACWNAEPWIMGIPVIGWKIKLLQKVIVGFLLYFRERLILWKSYITTKCPAYFLAELDTSIAFQQVV